MAEVKLFVVAKKDIVEQVREYIVRATSCEHAEQCVNNGLFICETESETVDLISSETTACEEIRMDIYDDQTGSAPKITRGSA